MKTLSTIILVIIFILAIIYFFYGNETFTFTAEVEGILVEAKDAGVINSGDRLRILIKLKDPIQKIIEIDCPSRPGVYSLDSYKVNENRGGYSIGITQDRDMFVTNSHYTGRAEITKLDVSLKKVSGTFEYAAVQVFRDHFGTRVVHITKGAFEDIPIREE
jgi:hypothetical protein